MFRQRLADIHYVRHGLICLFLSRCLIHVSLPVSASSLVHSSSVSALFCVQGEGPDRGKVYEALSLDREYLEPVEVHTPPHNDAGIGAQAPEAQLEQQAYVQMIADPEYNNLPQVCNNYPSNYNTM